MKMNKIITTFLVLIFLTSCDTSSLLSDSLSKYNNDSARGLTGGGTGGGIVIVENSKDFSATNNYKYTIYLEENGSKTPIQSGTYSKSGTIEIGQNTLDENKVKKLQDGSAKITVEIVNTDNNVKTAVEGKIQTKTSSGDNKEISLA